MTSALTTSTLLSTGKVIFQLQTDSDPLEIEIIYTQQQNPPELRFHVTNLSTKRKYSNKFDANAINKMGISKKLKLVYKIIKDVFDKKIESKIKIRYGYVPSPTTTATTTTSTTSTSSSTSTSSMSTGAVALSSSSTTTIELKDIPLLPKSENEHNELLLIFEHCDEYNEDIYTFLLLPTSISDIQRLTEILEDRKSEINSLKSEIMSLKSDNIKIIEKYINEIKIENEKKLNEIKNEYEKNIGQLRNELEISKNEIEKIKLKPKNENILLGVWKSNITQVPSRKIPWNLTIINPSSDFLTITDSNSKFIFKISGFYRIMARYTCYCSALTLYLNDKFIATGTSTTSGYQPSSINELINITSGQYIILQSYVHPEAPHPEMADDYLSIEFLQGNGSKERKEKS